jgi:hypothetical protein
VCGHGILCDVGVCRGGGGNGGGPSGREDDVGHRQTTKGLPPTTPFKPAISAVRIRIFHTPISVLKRPGCVGDDQDTETRNSTLLMILKIS